ncbi:LysR family transcriptional regulator [Occultella gossypii]|uniref:LysR family transcriptional regulator n=1 Tax=Occultella gossypii TaxID=2800820 RepID=A0ABS7S2U1_9MICO|nr:LysR family transcriptional regulator [Occultella gossypii]MBZ2194659.1 LysR family transcriptional regulator [Occultella gossypii]
MAARMDLVSACEVFVSVAERSSFTTGAAVAGVTQSVASRKVAALEVELGGRLFERTSRRVELTRLGREVLPAAERLVRSAGELRVDARRSRRRPITLGVPNGLPPAELAHLVATARRADLLLEVRTADPPERADALRSGVLDLGLEPVAADQARWCVPLGAGRSNGRGRDPAGDITFYLASIRSGRGTRPADARRIWIQPDDAVPHVRDRLVFAAHSAGLAPAQVRVATDMVGAVAEVWSRDDLVLCSEADAEQYGLGWAPMGDARLVRGYDVSGRDADLVRRFLGVAITDVAGALGAELSGRVEAPQ